MRAFLFPVVFSLFLAAFGENVSDQSFVNTNKIK